MTNWPKKYLREIQAGKIVADKKITALYERECAWMDKPPKDPDWKGWVFRPEIGQRHIDFMQKFCRQSKGKSGGKPIKFSLFQLAKMQLVFGWVDDKGLRRFREVIDIRARKCGKSTETAAVQHDMLLNDKEHGPEIYDVANSKDQAKLVFDECVNMRIQSPALKTVERKRQSDIYCEMNFGKIKALAAKTDNLDGLNGSFVCQDEWHTQKNSELYDVMKQSQAERSQPIYWLISTNGFQREGFFDSKYEYASNVALWEDGFHDYRTLPLIYELDDREEWTDPKKWEKANPGLGEIKSLDTLKDHVEQAKRDPSFLPTVITKDFNLPENSNEGWLQYDEAVNTDTVPMEYLEHSYAIGGCDLSATTDLTCATLLIRRKNDEKFYVLQKYFIPEGKLNPEDEKHRTDREAPYKRWAELGYLDICAGATVDYNAVTKWFVEMVNVHDIRPLWICYDAALSGYWVPQMEETGFIMDKIRQGPFTWTYPMKQLHGAFKDKQIIYQNNPILRWCLLNTAKKSKNADGIESIQPVKAASNRRIDGTVSLLNAFTGYQKHLDEFIPFLR